MLGYHEHFIFTNRSPLCHRFEPKLDRAEKDLGVVSIESRDVLALVLDSQTKDARLIKLPPLRFKLKSPQGYSKRDGHCSGLIVSKKFKDAIVTRLSLSRHYILGRALHDGSFIEGAHEYDNEFWRMVCSNIETSRMGVGSMFRYFR